ncbi:MAG: Zn-ribbon domain-containing OB-fold protein [Solirubrobacteraceae bacterium]
MTELEVQRCERCGTSAFPDRLWCPGCGAGDLGHGPAGPGRVEEETTVRRPPAAAPTDEPRRLGTVRLESGPKVIARLATGAGAGTRVRLETAPEGAIWAHPTPD